MADRQYYVRCKTGCLAEALTKEQTLAAITQAIETGEIKDVDTGFITKIKEQNAAQGLAFWVGTTAEYNAITKKIDGCLYIITDDTTGEDLSQAVTDLQKRVDDIVINNPIVPQIVVRTNGGFVTCTDEAGKKVESIDGDGVWVFNISHYGKYTIVFTHNDITKTEIVNVTAVQQYDVGLSSYSTTFAENSWEDIIDAVKLNLVPQEWAAGDEKELATTSGDKYRVCVLGKNHDQYEDGTAAPLTFGIVGGVDGVEYKAAMNETATNNGGWEQTNMRQSIMALFISQFSEAIQAAIKPVKKRSITGGAEIGTTLDNMFLLSCDEINGNSNSEGDQYEYFKNGSLYETGSSWTRSFGSTTQDSFWVAQNGGGSFTKAAATSNIKILPAFCF